jgi:hypothetical protein
MDVSKMTKTERIKLRQKIKAIELKIKAMNNLLTDLQGSLKEQWL